MKQQPDISDITIGIPVFNEADRIEMAVRSAAVQCGRLIISDNASTDQTFDICSRLAAEYDNIVLIRQPQNMGSLHNFKFILDLSTTEYFMWLGAHDRIPRCYTTKLREGLAKDPTIALAYGSALRVSLSGQIIREHNYDYRENLSDGGGASRFISVLRWLDDCTLFHGLFRATKLKAAWDDNQTLGCDFIILARLALLGRFHYQPTTAYHRLEIHTAEPLSMQLSRISGRTQNDRGGHLYRPMQARLYEISKEARNGSGGRKFLALRARYWLVVRFGAFGPGRLRLFLDRATSYLSRKLYFTLAHS